MTLDPVHVGTGGYRLGRVDLSIVREPGTRLPKIPGTSLHGATRHYAAYRYGKKQCAGQKEHCAAPACPVCYTFGYAKGEGGGHAGVVSIGDARVLLFPVYSMAGPLWVSTEEILTETGFILNEVEATKNDGTEVLSTMNWNGPLNLGWLMVEIKKQVQIDLPPVKDKGAVKPDGLFKEWGAVKDRVILVPPRIFSQIVNSNLEVRTSVSIDPGTGAAAEGALYTYEAIPRASFLWLDVIIDDYRGAFPAYQSLRNWEEILKQSNTRKQEAFVLLKKTGYLAGYSDIPAGPDTNLRKKFDSDFADACSKLKGIITEEKKYYEKNSSLRKECRWGKTNNGDTPADVVAAGLEWAEHLGIGGMGTRGFGRVRTTGEPWEGPARGGEKS
ncbi:MAG: type III-B CRISPR module RAMP protein Cmr4 [Peptococcaceae bacterium]|nr:MAG: type III-B CRISPR module RAMP protein Cmr4 [Peptococcaceae bacterium]